MNELLDLLTNWAHWAFEIISGGVFFAAGLIVPERYNPVKRLVTRHDREKHGAQKDDRAERMVRLGAWLDELDAVHGVPSEEARSQAQEWFNGSREEDPGDAARPPHDRILAPPFL